MYAFTIINAYGNKTIPVQFYQKTKQNKRKTTQTQKTPPPPKKISFPPPILFFKNKQR